jgi:hypothetical protein
MPAELNLAGFVPLDILIQSMKVNYGAGCEWTTLGNVPTGPGLYGFTLEDQDQLRVTYVGKTEELWMITKGRLPSGRARPAQRYGRPRYAGENRKRINFLIAKQLRAGRTMCHWVYPMSDGPEERSELNARLLHAESELISRWELRRLGWNRR